MALQPGGDGRGTLSTRDGLVFRTMGEAGGTSGTPAVEATGGETPLVEAIAAGVAHEVRNPLNSLQINLSILEQELGGDRSRPRPPRASRCIGKIAGELRSLDDFVTEFLRFARPPRPALEPVAVRPLLADLATFIAPECSPQGGRALARPRTAARKR